MHIKKAVHIYISGWIFTQLYRAHDLIACQSVSCSTPFAKRIGRVGDDIGGRLVDPGDE